MMKILLAEDALDIQMLLRVWLEEYGYTVMTANNGQEALDILAAHDDIHLVLSDWVMPVFSGLELCRYVRADKQRSYVYFILLTGNEDREAMIEGMEAGADDFLLKPINKNELRVRLSAGARIVTLEQNLEERNQALSESKRKVQAAYEQISRDLQTAAKMQRALLPAPGVLGNIHFDWLFYPSSFMAGDMLNYFELNDDYIGFYQLDVAGHGVSSALLSFTLYHHINNESNQSDLLLRTDEHGQLMPVPPEKVVKQLNQWFQSSPEQMLYFTMVYGYIQRHTGELSFTQAGHPRPIVLQADDGSCRLCGEGGFPVGMLPDLDYDSVRLQLDKGDRLFLYSDGIPECQNPAGEEFGDKRLMSILADHAHATLPNVLEALGNSLADWHGKTEFEDDVTLLVIERE